MVVGEERYREAHCPSWEVFCFLSSLGSLTGYEAKPPSMPGSPPPPKLVVALPLPLCP